MYRQLIILFLTLPGLAQGQWELEHVITGTPTPIFTNYSVIHSQFANENIGLFTEYMYLSPSNGSQYQLNEFDGSGWSSLFGVGGVQPWSFRGLYGIFDPPIVFVLEQSNWTFGGIGIRSYNGDSLSGPIMIHWRHMAFHA